MLEIDPVRVGIDVARALDPTDGIGRYCRGLTRALLELEPAQGTAVRYRLFDTSGAPARGDGRFGPVEIEPFTASTAERIDVLYCGGHTVPQPYRGPLVFTVHDLTYMTMPERHTQRNRAVCVVGLARALARGARIAANSETSRQQLATLLSVDPDSVTVARPGLDPTFLTAASSHREADPELRPGYVLFVGTMEPRKNLTGLLAAHRSLRAEIRDAHPLVIAGGAGWGEVASLVGDERRAVRVLGRVGDDQLPALYADAAVFAFPSLWEGFGLPPLEAMACGTPVVVSDRGALPEVVGDAGEIVDPTSTEALRDALERVLVDDARARALAQRGLERSQRYRWEPTARIMRELFVEAARAARVSR